MLLLDREESIRQFDLYSLLLEKDISLTNLFSESDDPHYVDPTLDWVQHVAPEEMNRFQGPRGFKNHFLKGILSEDSSTAFHITVKADFADKSPNYVADTYALPDFPGMLGAYIDTIPGDHSRLRGRLLKGWFKFRLQLQSRLNPHKLMPSQQVQALLPSDKHPFGKCDAVLVHYTLPEGSNSEFFPAKLFHYSFRFPAVAIAQVRTIFAFSSRGSPLPSELSRPLLYVEYFAFIATPADQPEVGMYTIRRMFVDNRDGRRSRVGSIISLLDVIHAVELIPKYGVAANCEVTSETCLKLYDKFYLNNFSDKEWHYTIHHDYVV